MVSVTDKRLLRGAQTRKVVLERAVGIASLDSLEGVTFGRLAADTGLSKAGIQTLFKTKEALQVAVVEYARKRFVEDVTQPARSAMPGVARLRALIDNWTVYVTEGLCEGGCFRAANLAVFDSKPGPVHDALFRDHQAWLDVLAGELRHAIDSGEIVDRDVELTAFHIDALLSAANMMQQAGDKGAIGKACRIIECLLTAPR